MLNIPLSIQIYPCTVRPWYFQPRPKSPKLKLLFLVSTMWNNSESPKKTICQWVSLQNRFFTMYLRLNLHQNSLKCIVKKLSRREIRWQTVFLDDSDLFHIILSRKSSISFGLFGLGKKWQKCIVITIRVVF